MRYSTVISLDFHVSSDVVFFSCVRVISVIFMSRATLQAINLRKFGTPWTNFGRKNYALQKAINDLSHQVRGY
jgi:hypothetical protein